MEEKFNDKIYLILKSNGKYEIGHSDPRPMLPYAHEWVEVWEYTKTKKVK